VSPYLNNREKPKGNNGSFRNYRPHGWRFGVAKQSGLVYFVKGIVAPGDVVRAVVASQRKNYAEAELVELVQRALTEQNQCVHISLSAAGASFNTYPIKSNFNGRAILQAKTYGNSLGKRWTTCKLSLQTRSMATEQKPTSRSVKKETFWMLVTLVKWQMVRLDYLPILQEPLWETAQGVLSVMRQHRLRSYFTSGGTLRHLQVRASLLSGERQVLVTFSHFPKTLKP